MKIFRHVSLAICFSILVINYSEAQNTYMDNALNYSRLIIQKTEAGFYKQVGIFKVVGTSYLFGEKNKGNLFSPEAKAYNIFLSYNTYNQEVEFYSSGNPDKPLIKEPGTVDSFIIQENVALGINHPLKFVYGTHIGSSEKSYYLEIYAGSKYSVYKRYKSDLGYVSTNYVQSELRQFDLLYDYYYADASKDGLKKLKANSASIIKELKSIKDISTVFTNEAFTMDQEEALRVAFEYLNK